MAIKCVMTPNRWCLVAVGNICVSDDTNTFSHRQSKIKKKKKKREKNHNIYNRRMNKRMKRKMKMIKHSKMSKRSAREKEGEMKNNKQQPKLVYYRLKNKKRKERKKTGSYNTHPNEREIHTHLKISI